MEMFIKQTSQGWTQAKPLMKKNKIRELIDPSLAGEYEWTQIKLVVVEILKGNLNDLKCITKCRVPFIEKLLEMRTCQEILRKLDLEERKWMKLNKGKRRDIDGLHHF
ncbi:hypothetical protein Bca52824_018014 [Brassica carinata]|uniref:Uncharacterized protein n=1 Tax=Brassica carinata TaxID=52824 RepID=A0A8X8AYZ5_BRACI|nr:hypothetical protein Bca52824_018014 [Brassica carinata]